MDDQLAGKRVVILFNSNGQRVGKSSANSMTYSGEQLAIEDSLATFEHPYWVGFFGGFSMPSPGWGESSTGAVCGIALLLSFVGEY